MFERLGKPLQSLLELLLKREMNVQGIIEDPAFFIENGLQTQPRVPYCEWVFQL